MTRYFLPGQRVEFRSMGARRDKVFRGVIEQRLAHGLYWFVDDGETRGRIVSGARLSVCAPVAVVRDRGGAA